MTRSPRKRRLAGTEGFTLVELLVTMLIVGIVAAAILTLYENSMRVAASEQNRMQSQDAARLAINQIARYFRAATDSESNRSTHSDAVAVAGPKDLVFYADIDGNDLAEKVRYYVSEGGALMMQTASPVMSDNPPTYPAFETDGILVQQGVDSSGGPLFTYFYYDQDDTDGDGERLEQFTPATPADRERVAAVGIDITVNESPQLSPSGVRLQTSVQIRQRYDGDLQQ
jgi:prepilin-type N-terminal cleavage/methylation domain-containing protein